jgi:addiction module HigA family antidote
MERLSSTHPGPYIKVQVLPKKLSVTKAAELLGVGRPALSNLLNANAALTSDMALRIQKTFGADAQELLAMQANYDEAENRDRAKDVAVHTYVPAFLKFEAKQISAWTNGNIEARAHLPAFLRRLVQSTGTALSKVDFPAYDNSQRYGWDGFVASDIATPWIPRGNSGWEFGCNQNPAAKAEVDFAARTASVPAEERSSTSFVFVSPHNWPGKEDWAKEKRRTGGWKNVRVLDASDLEQWLEQSIPAQAWFGNQIGNGADGMLAPDAYWTEWAGATNPPLSKILFKVPISTHRGKLENWLSKPPKAPLVVTADSEGEALAYLACALMEIGTPPGVFADKAIILKSAEALKRTAALSADFIAIVSTPDVETVSATYQKSHHVLIVRRRNDISSEGDITLDLVDGLTFHEALADMKLHEPDFARYSRETANSPTILRRRLSNVPAIQRPAWASDIALARRLIPLNLVGVWDVDKPADGEIVRCLANREYQDIEQSVAEFRTVPDAPMWSIGRYRGVTSKIDVLFATHRLVTKKDLEDFLAIAQYVLQESDPALDLPQDQQWAANIYGKVRDHSSALRAGVCETLVLLAAHGNTLFQARLGIDVQARVNDVVRSLLLPLNERTWASQKHDLPRYAEAAPDVFLDILEQDLASAEPKIFTLLQPADAGPFGGCPRTGLLWALETLAWKSDRLLRVSLILARLAEIPINDNWGNKPAASLQAIYRSWMPQTAADIGERNMAMEEICRRFPSVGWRRIVEELGSHHAVGHYSSRPHWRNDASGAGQTVKTWDEAYPVMNKAHELALAWPKHDQHTLGDLVSRLEFLREEDHEKVWSLIKDWAATEADDEARGVLRETIRKNAFTRRAKMRGVKQPVKDRAREAYTLLQPRDVVVRHLWLFAQHWVEESADELEEGDLDYEKRTARIEAQRTKALNEIWRDLGYDGLLSLCELSRSESAIGRCLFDIVPATERLSILERLVSQAPPPAAIKIDIVISGFLDRLGNERGVTIETLLRGFISSGARDNAIRLLKCAPFRAEIWAHLTAMPPQWEKLYWKDAYVRWERQSESEFTTLVTKLIEVGRPWAAFETVHMDLKQVETRLLLEMLRAAVTSSEPHARSAMDGYYISEAFKNLKSRSGVGKSELAQLEFMYVPALEHSEYGIPTLQEVLTEDPKLFMQLVALVYRRKDEGEDPPEWKIPDEDRRKDIATSVFGLLHRMVRFPGTAKNGAIDGKKLRNWIAQARELGRQYGREDTVDSVVGEILGRCPAEPDGVWPCEAVRQALDEFGSLRMANGVSIGRRNMRGAQFRGPNGDEERAMAAQYRSWAKAVSYQYPFTARMLVEMAEGYDREAVWHDTDASVRKRLNH